MRVPLPAHLILTRRASEPIPRDAVAWRWSDVSISPWAASKRGGMCWSAPRSPASLSRLRP